MIGTPSPPVKAAVGQWRLRLAGAAADAPTLAAIILTPADFMLRCIRYRDQDPIHVTPRSCLRFTLAPPAAGPP